MLIFEGVRGFHVEALRQLIAAQPGLSQRELVRRASVPLHRGVQLLREGEGREWKSARGARCTICYDPLSSSDQWESR